MTTRRTTKIRNLIRWTVLALGLGVSLVYLNSSLFCFWVAGGPPTDYPRAYFHQGVRMLCFSFAIFAATLGLFFGFGSYRRDLKLVIVCASVLAIGATLAYPPVREFFLVDECLDSGGAWHEPYFHCDQREGCPVTSSSPAP